MTEGFRLDTTKPTDDFNRHLSIEGNNRIIFSGPFGSGKTTFLKEYFESKEDYEVFHLFPVNYSVSSNGDIFELIKFDLLFELLGKDVDLEKEDFSKQMTLQMFLLNNQLDVATTFYDSIKPLFEGISKIGKDVTEIFNPISKLYEKWKKYHAEIQVDEKKGILAYLESFTKEAGSIHEEDIFTQIIRNLLNQIKEKGKKTILIIDDLDRIDPEHIFRLLNIFAAHFDSPSYRCEENKFGFSQIMLVCDLNNIRNIFFNKYGQNVDFTGYIDKFYSKDVFVFDNLRIVEDTILNVLKSIQYCNISKIHIAGMGKHRGLILKILEELVRSHSLNLRDLEKVWKLKYTFQSKEILCVNLRKMYSLQFYELILIDFLASFFGDVENLKMAVTKTINSNIFSGYNKNNQYECATILTLILQDVHFFETKRDFNATHILKVPNFSFKLEYDHDSDLCFINADQPRPEHENINTNFFELFLKVIEMAQTKNYIN
jgi:KAP family P-loop domain